MADIASNLPVRDTADGAAGSAVPAQTLQIGGTDGANLRTLLTDSGGKLLLSNLPAIVDTNYGAVSNNTLRVASEISNSAGAALFGAGTTTTQVLRVVLPTDQTSIPITHLDTAPATQNITALDVGTASLVGANGQVFYFGTPTTNSAATFTLSSIETVSVQATLIGAGGTMVVEVSMDSGASWLRPNVYQISTQNYSNGFTAPFMAIVNVSGMTNIRVRGTVSWTGTGTITVKETINQRSLTIGDSLPTGTNSIGTVKAQLQDNSGTAITLGQKVMSSSLPVVLASDQSTITVQGPSGVAGTPSGGILTVQGVSSGTAFSIIQNVTASTSNSSTANLASAATFTGVSESTLGVAAVQVNFIADQNCTIQVQQSTNGTNWDIVDSYRLLANTGDGRTFQATASFFRILVTNNGGSTTTSLRLQVALCPIVESIPRSLTPEGNLKTSVAAEATNFYSAPVNIRQTAATAANATVWAMRNAAASTKNVVIERIYLMMSFDTATPIGRALLRYDIERFTTATPTAGSAITVVLMDSQQAATQVTDVRFIDTGLTTTSVVFGTPIATIGCPATDATSNHYCRENVGIRLAPGEGLAIRLNVVAVAGQGLTGEIVWSEK